MKLNTKALSLTCAICLGGSVFLIGLANLMWPPYGEALLQLAASVYPGYSGLPSIFQILVGTVYALVDGLVIGLAFGWIYNGFVVRMSLFGK